MGTFIGGLMLLRLSVASLFLLDKIEGPHIGFTVTLFRHLKIPSIVLYILTVLIGSTGMFLLIL